MLSTCIIHIQSQHLRSTGIQGHPGLHRELEASLANDTLFQMGKRGKRVEFALYSLGTHVLYTWLFCIIVVAIQCQVGGHSLEKIKSGS